MRHAIARIVLDAIEAAAGASELKLDYTPETAVERPRDPANGDWATTVALRLAKELGRPPREIAQAIAAHIPTTATSIVAAVEVAGPGFINLRLSNDCLHQAVRDAHEQGRSYGRSNEGEGRTVNVEFVSANPTGPLHVGHGRWAALGNALANVLEHAGWQVTREFYINDAGVQMDVFGHSVALRYLELHGRTIEMPENSYGGSFVVDIAQHIKDEEGDTWLDALSAARDEHFREVAYQLMLTHMQQLLAGIGIPFDTWFSERSLYAQGGEQGVQGTDAVLAILSEKAAKARSGAQSARSEAKIVAQSGPSQPSGREGEPEPHPSPAPPARLPTPIDAALETLAADGYLYEEAGATWFRSTDFGDDKPRVLVKADGSYTYFAPDIAYHLSKYNRGSDYLIDIWGADHHGYVPRMMAACEALGHGGRLTVVLGQLVNLFRNGEAVRMSKRTGEMVTFEELIDEVGADATKYLMLARSTDQPLDFDIEAAKKQDATNPVYYVQYAHARICSLLRKATQKAGPAPLDPAPLDPAPHDPAPLDPAPPLTLLVHPAELDLARTIARFGEVVEDCARDLAPFRLTHYAEDLATGFHKFYTECQVITNDAPLTAARLYLASATRNVLALVLDLLGVTAPERM